MSHPEEIPVQTHPTSDRTGVVVGIDGTWLALGAVTWAAVEAHVRGVPLHLVYGAPDASTATTHVQDVLDRGCATARHAEPDLLVTAEHVDGAPVRSLLDATTAAALLAVGMAERDRTEELVLGSVALDVSGRASCAVVVVRGEHRLPGGDGPVLVGVDDAAVDGPALTVAFADARRHHSRLVVLHVRQRTGPVREYPSEQEQADHTDAWNRLCDALEPWSERYPDVPVDVRVARGHPSRALLAAAAEARLVVVGTRGRSAPVRALFGSTSREVLRQSPVPVVVVSPAAAMRGEAAVAVTTAAPLPTGQASARTERDHPHDPARLW
jgi:nucleotide-binding universal stress UspA family protein